MGAADDLAGSRGRPTSPPPPRREGQFQTASPAGAAAGLHSRPVRCEIDVMALAEGEGGRGWELAKWRRRGGGLDGADRCRSRLLLSRLVSSRRLRASASRWEGRKEGRLGRTHRADVHRIRVFPPPPSSSGSQPYVPRLTGAAAAEGGPRLSGHAAGADGREPNAARTNAVTPGAGWPPMACSSGDGSATEAKAPFRAAAPATPATLHH